MLNIAEEILINKYGQGVITIDPLVNLFNNLGIENKKNYLEEILHLILQSKPNNDDIEPAIEQSKLRPTYTPCILLKRGGVANHNLKKLVNLPNNEQEKVLILLMSLFRIAYLRRFNNEKNNPGKWWYWDLSEPNIEDKILKNY
jgi:transcription initiation factor IIE alpha subunit